MNVPCGTGTLGRYSAVCSSGDTKTASVTQKFTVTAAKSQPVNSSLRVKKFDSTLTSSLSSTHSAAPSKVRTVSVLSFFI